MGDTEGAAPPSKKRFAAGQLSRDNPGLDDDGPEPEMGTFQRASDEVLATRRIVKVRRHPPPAASDAAANPFAGLSFATKIDSDVKATTAETQPPPTAESQTQPTTEPQTQLPDKEVQKVDDSSQLKPEEEDEEDKETENATRENEANGSKDDVQNGQPDDNRQLENKTGSEKDEMVKETSCSAEADKEVENGKLEAESETRTSTEEVGIESKNEDREEAVQEVRDESGERREAVQEAKDESGERKEAVQEGKDESGEKKVDSDQKDKTESVSSLKSFQQLSSSQNAFSGLAGTGFSGSSFSFGSIAKEGSSFGTGSGSLFGLSNDKPSYPSLNTSHGYPLKVFSTTPSDATKSGGGGMAALQEVPVETGEENEKLVFNADAILFEYLDGSWKERGKGEIKVNVSTSDDERARLVMRAKGNYRLILNANLYPDMSLTNMEKRGITFACVNSAGEGKGGLATFALKFKDASIVEEFRGAVTAHKGKKATATLLRTPENSPKASDD